MYRLYLQLCTNSKTQKDAFVVYDYVSGVLESQFSINKRLGHNEEENMYRIFIDLPIDAISTEDAVLQGNTIMELFIDSDKFTPAFTGVGVTRINYRLGNDTEEKMVNYFMDKNHVIGLDTAE